MYFNPKSSKHSISVSSSLSPRAAMYSGLIPPLPGDDPLFASIARSDSLKPTNESMGERFGTEDGSTSRLAGNFSCSCVSTEGLLMSVALWDEPNAGLKCQSRSSSDPTKGVGCLKQQDGGHGSRNPLRSV